MRQAKPYTAFWWASKIDLNSALLTVLLLNTIQGRKGYGRVRVEGHIMLVRDDEYRIH